MGTIASRAVWSRVESGYALPPVCPEQLGPTTLRALFFSPPGAGPCLCPVEPPLPTSGARGPAGVDASSQSFAPTSCCSRHPGSPGRQRSRWGHRPAAATRPWGPARTWNPGGPRTPLSRPELSVMCLPPSAGGSGGRGRGPRGQLLGPVQLAPKTRLDGRGVPSAPVSTGTRLLRPPGLTCFSTASGS